MPSLASAPAAIRWILAATAAVWVVLELRQSLARRPEGVKAGWRGEIAFRAASACGALVAVLLSHMAPAATIRPAAVAAWAGLVLFWCGICLRLRSFRALGRYFTFVVQTSADQPVIAAGPYRVIRHPSYAGLLLTIIALGLFIGNWGSLASLTVTMTAGLAYRIRLEERALLDDLGAAYGDYAAGRKRLVPFVW